MEIIGKIVIVFVVIIVWCAAMALPVMLLWNWLMPAIFGLKVITFWQSLGVLLLSGILFRANASTKVT